MADGTDDPLDTSAARAEVLARIRRALGWQRPERTSGATLLERHYRREGTLSLEQRIELLRDRLLDYDAGVYRASAPDLPRCIGDVLAMRGRRRMVVPPDLPRAWLPGGVDITPDVQLSHDALDRSDGAITGCTLAIAWTGTIVLQGGPLEGRRALTLVPDYHLCVVRTEQIVELLPEAMARLRAARAGPITFISGPSATADIEMTRIKGVHGPRVLDVVIVG